MSVVEEEITPSCLRWKLYDNPYFVGDETGQASSSFSSSDEQIPASELVAAKAHIEELKVELDLDRRIRKRVESLNMSMAKDLLEERSARMAAEKESERLIAEAEEAKERSQRLENEMEEERNMLRIAEVWREERVQMKLLDARLAMEEKLQEIMLASGDGSSMQTWPEMEKKMAQKNSDSPRGGSQVKKEVDGKFQKTRRSRPAINSGGGIIMPAARGSEKKTTLKSTTEKNKSEGSYNIGLVGALELSVER